MFVTAATLWTLPFVAVFAFSNAILLQFNSSGNVGQSQESSPTGTGDGVDPNDCSLNINIKTRYDAIKSLDEKYRKARQDFQNLIDGVHADEKMMKVLLSRHPRAAVPAGLPLGRRVMAAPDNTLLLISHLRVLNESAVSLVGLRTAGAALALRGSLTLPVLRLAGRYQRVLAGAASGLADAGMSSGELLLVLSNVSYTLEARSSVWRRELRADTLESTLAARRAELQFGDTMIQVIASNGMIYLNDLLEQIKGDIDEWVKDELNTYQRHYAELGAAAGPAVRKYDMLRRLASTKYADDVIGSLTLRARTLGVTNLRLPSLTIPSAVNLTAEEPWHIRLWGGEVRGVDTLRRRGAAAGLRRGSRLRLYVDAAFTGLTMVYNYEILQGVDGIYNGTFYLSPNEMSIHLGIIMETQPKEHLMIYFDSVKNIKPKSLVVEGTLAHMPGAHQAAVRSQVLSLITFLLLNNIQQLNQLTGCDPGNFNGTPALVENEESSQELRKDMPETTEHETLVKTVSTKLLDLAAPLAKAATTTDAPIVLKTTQFSDECDLSDESPNVIHGKK